MNELSRFPFLPPMFSYFCHLICGTVLLDPLSLLEGFSPLLFIFLEGNFLGSPPLLLPGPCDFLLDSIFLEFIYQFFIVVCHIILAMDIWFGGQWKCHLWFSHGTLVWRRIHAFSFIVTSPLRSWLFFKTEMSFRFFRPRCLFINLILLLTMYAS